MKPSVSIWTTSQLGYDQRIQRIISTIESMDASVTVWDRKTGHRSGGKIHTLKESGPGFYLDYNRQIARLVGQQQSDLVYAADIDVMPGLMWGLKGRKKPPFLLDLHEWYPEVIELEGKPIKRKIWRWIERRSVAFATAHMTVNQSLKYIFEQQYGKEFTVVRNVPKAESDIEISPDIRLTNKILYYQGAINEGRGLETAVESLHLLPDWRLWLAGEGDISAYLKDKVAIEGLEDRVVFFGRMHPEDLPGLAGQATLGLNLLSGQSKSYYYSLANKYFDYIHAGLPAIHMDFPEYRNLMKDFKVGSFLFELSPQALAGVVKQSIDDNNQYARYLENCYSAKNLYNWQEESKVLVEMLRRLAIMGE